jgi:hypothetical protein
MSGEIINLNKARKAKEKAGAKVRAVQNRAKHGQSAAEHAKALWDRLQDQRKLDAHKRDPAKD